MDVHSRVYNDAEGVALVKWSSLACGARGPRFDSRFRHYDIRDWLSPASKSQYDLMIKYCSWPAFFPPYGRVKFVILYTQTIF